MNTIMKKQHNILTIICIFIVFVVKAVMSGVQICNPKIEYEVYLEGELQKYPELDPEKLERIRNRAKANTELPPINRREYVLFLHSANFDEDEAYKKLVRYYTARKQLPHIFPSKDPTEEELHKVYDVMSHSMLYTENEDKGVHYLYTEFKDFNPRHFNFVEQAKYYFLMIKCLLLEYGTFDGVVVIWNLKGLKYRHLWKIRLIYRLQVYRLLQLIQYGVPLRIKEAHIVNAGFFTNYAYTVVSPFLKDDFRKKIKLHRPNSKRVFDSVSRDIMPLEYLGGRGLSHIEQSETTLKRMKLIRDQYTYLDNAENCQNKWTSRLCRFLFE